MLSDNVALSVVQPEFLLRIVQGRHRMMKPVQTLAVRQRFLIVPVIEKIIVQQRPADQIPLIAVHLELFIDQQAVSRHIHAVIVHGHIAMLQMPLCALEILRIQNILPVMPEQLVHPLVPVIKLPNPLSASFSSISEHFLHLHSVCAPDRFPAPHNAAFSRLLYKNKLDQYHITNRSHPDAEQDIFLPEMQSCHQRSGKQRRKEMGCALKIYVAETVYHQNRHDNDKKRRHGKIDPGTVKSNIPARLRADHRPCNPGISRLTTVFPVSYTRSPSISL